MTSIGAVVGVKDEAELIAPCIERLWAVGVEAIVVLDDHSTDGAAEIVDALAAQSGDRLNRVTFVADFKTNLRRDGPALQWLISTHAPDWILFTDADEFWLPSGDNLQPIVKRAQTDALLIERFNTPLINPAFAPRYGADSAPFLEAPIIAEREQLTRASLGDGDARWVMNAIAPKLLCRTAKLATFEPGAHNARAADGSRLSTSTPLDVIIVHLPLTTYARFDQKVENTRAFFARWGDHYPGDMAWHWKHWIELKDAGKLPEEFERQGIGDAELAALRAAGVVKSAGEVLAGRMR